MMTAKEAYKESQKSINRKVESAIAEAIADGKTKVFIPFALPEHLRKELLEKGYDLSLSKENSTILFDEGASGKVLESLPTLDMFS